MERKKREEKTERKKSTCKNESTPTCIIKGQTIVWPIFGSDVTYLARISSCCWKCIRIDLFELANKNNNNNQNPPIVSGFLFLSLSFYLSKTLCVRWTPFLWLTVWTKRNLFVGKWWFVDGVIYYRILSLWQFVIGLHSSWLIASRWLRMYKVFALRLIRVKWLQKKYFTRFLHLQRQWMVFFVRFNGSSGN